MLGVVMPTNGKSCFKKRVLSVVGTLGVCFIVGMGLLEDI